MLKACLVNYNYTPEWLKGYDFDYIIYDRSEDKNLLVDFPQERIIRTENRGNVDYDKLSYLVDNYDTLPAVFLWGKSNLFKYITKEEFDEALKTPEFKPLLTQHHKTYGDKNGPICFYQDGMYYERNDYWYLYQHTSFFKTWQEWAFEFQLPSPRYIPFPPGGNFLLTRERVHRYSRDFYEAMRDTLPYCQLPGEAQLAERSYYLLWQ